MTFNVWGSWHTLSPRTFSCRGLVADMSHVFPASSPVRSSQSKILFQMAELGSKAPRSRCPLEANGDRANQPILVKQQFSNDM